MAGFSMLRFCQIDPRLVRLIRFFGRVKHGPHQGQAGELGGGAERRNSAGN